MNTFYFFLNWWLGFVCERVAFLRGKSHRAMWITFNLKHAKCQYILVHSLHYSNKLQINSDLSVQQFKLKWYYICIPEMDMKWLRGEGGGGPTLPQGYRVIWMFIGRENQKRPTTKIILKLKYSIQGLDY